MEIRDSVITRRQRYGYAVMNIPLSKQDANRGITWTFNAKRLKGLVGYGITVFPFPIDVENRGNFKEDTIMVRSDSGYINGGQIDKERHSALQWKVGDTVKCYFDQRKRYFSMRKNDEKWVTIEKEVSVGKVFYPFVAFSNPIAAANGDQIDFQF